jgi:hypothetical protein
MGWRAGRDLEIASAIGQIGEEAVATGKARRDEETALLDARTGGTA